MHIADAPIHRHRRPVKWMKLGVPRTVFTRPALNEIGSAITLFGIKKHAAEFLAVLEEPSDSDAAVTAAIDHAQAEAPEEAVDEPRAARVDRFTRDFVLDQLKRPTSHIAILRSSRPIC